MLEIAPNLRYVRLGAIAIWGVAFENCERISKRISSCVSTVLSLITRHLLLCTVTIF